MSSGRISAREFEAYVEEALAQVPANFRQYLENVVVAVEEEPSEEDYDETGAADDSELFGIFRGVPFIEQADELVSDIREEVERSLAVSAQEGVREIDLLQQGLHDDLAAFVYERLRRRPMVLPVVVEV